MFTETNAFPEKSNPRLIHQNEIEEAQPSSLDQTPETPEAEPVNNDFEVSFYLENISAIEREIQRNYKLMIAELERRSAFYEHIIGQLEKQKRFWAAPIESFWRKFCLDNPKSKKSRQFADGTIKLYHTGGGIVLTDDFKIDISAAWTKVKYEVDKTILKKHIKETGEIPDGVDFLPDEDKFKIFIGGDKDENPDMS